MQIPLNQYTDEIKYIYTKDRPEVGIAEQVNYVKRNNYEYVQISGHFLENEINRFAVYPKCISNTLLDMPTYSEYEGKTEEIAHVFYRDFKKLKIAAGVVGTSQYISELDINEAELPDEPKGNTRVIVREAGQLGDVLYSILKMDELSQRVTYDFEENIKTWEVWQGLDRRETNTDGNNPIIFSTKYGNIKTPNVLIDRTNYKNGILMENDYTDSQNQNVINVRPKMKASNEGAGDSWAFEVSTVNRSDYNTTAEYEAALAEETEKRLYDYYTINNIEFDAMTGSYDYMEDFDLGDLCNVEIPELHMAAEARMIGCYEVIKDGAWTMTMEFGTPLIKNK